MIIFSSNQKIGEGESNMLKKVFNWSEVHLSEMTCYKIHTLVDQGNLSRGIDNCLGATQPVILLPCVLLKKAS